MSKLPIIFLMGPTASGKTSLAIEIAQQLPVEIISVDSAMIYKTMNIGTGKPPADVLNIIPHHLIDILDPRETYSAGKFREDALLLISDIHKRGKIPILVGGTMLYFKALKYGISPLPKGDYFIRHQLVEQQQKFGLAYLHQKLKQIDPVAADRIHPNDLQRTLRALEVFEITGKTLTEHFIAQTKSIQDFHLIELALATEERAILHQKIQKRFECMLQQGFIDEVKNLYNRGDLTLENPSVRSVGYRQIWEYLHQHYDFNTMKEKAIAVTRQLAKRQLTWLRSWQNIQWFYIDRDTYQPYDLISFLRKQLNIVCKQKY